VSFVAGEWLSGQGDGRIEVVNPADGSALGSVETASAAILDRALAASACGFERWRKISAYDRARILARGAELIRSRSVAIGAVLTLEQGKPLAEATGEVVTAADNLQWMAEEATRAYGRVLVPRIAGVRQAVMREPVGPVASFCPWNFPALTPGRKIAGALAAGCSLILKPSEETPFTSREIVQCMLDGGLPEDVLSLVYGVPERVSRHLILSSQVRKISFTGSTAVGKQLLALAALGAKRATMELGGHAPVVVLDDVDPVEAATAAAVAKFRNAGQVCTSPTRFLVQRDIHDAFVATFREKASAIRVGDGMDWRTQMGPLANERRVRAMTSLVGDAIELGARLESGGQALAGPGYFYAPTVLSSVPAGARVMHEEPFGPVALIVAFDKPEQALAIANGTGYGLAAYVVTKSLARATYVSEALEAGVVAVNHYTVSTPASPFGGVKESGYGSEGGVEGLDAYLVTKNVTTSVAGLAP